MAVDYSGALDSMLPLSYSFDSCDALSIVVHQTGGDMTLDAVHQTFLQTMRSTHFAIDRIGRVAQYVPLARGAGGNCCPDKTATGQLLCSTYWLPYVQAYGNLNLCTISIEHCNDSTNSLQMTAAQMQASQELILWLCRRFHLNINHIKGHDTINPINKPFCPRTYDFAQLEYYLKEQGVTSFMEQQFDAVWLQATGGYKSGIYQIVKQGFLTKKYSACFPTSSEISTIDTNGNAILFQTLSNGYHAEYAAGRATIKDGQDRVLYQGMLP